MAKAAWCTVAPTSGTGNKTIAISASAHTGRTARSTTVTVQNQSGTKPSKAIVVTQTAKPEFVTFTSKTQQLPATGGIASVIGTSNKAAIQANEDGDMWLDNSSLKINNVAQTTTGGGTFTIGNSLGVNEQYTFEFSINLPPNTSALPDEYTYTIDGATGSTLKVVVAAAASTLNTDKTSLSLVTAGTAQNISVTSNDNWVIS